MATATLVNPPPTPIRGLSGVVKFTPAPTDVPPAPLDPAPRFHAEHCRICTPAQTDPWTSDLYVAKLAGAVVDDTATVAVPRMFGPDLTAGQRRLLQAELPRLFRLLKLRRDEADGTVTRYGVRAVLVILEDMAGQAPDLDATLAEEAARRRETAAARPTVALALGQNKRQGGAR